MDKRIDMICSPEALIPGDKKEKIYCFLVGPIKNAPEWQFKVPTIDNLIWLNPRRPIKIEGDLPKDEWDKQISWETEGLRVSDYIICWIPAPINSTCIDYAKTTRSEILEVLARGKNVIVGIDDSFPGKKYIEVKAKNQYGVKVVHNSLDSCIDELKIRIKSKINNKFKNYLTSDTHFNQQRTLDLSKRPFINVNEMNWSLIEKWNNTVSPFDTVFHLGDFGDWSYAKYLNGNIVLILGNYEKKEMNDKGLDYIDYHDWVIDSFKFKEVFFNYTTLNIDSDDLDVHEEVKLIHEPSKFFERERYKYACFGHTHGRQMIKPWGLDVGVDCHNFTPISESDVSFYINALKRGFYDKEVFIN